MFAGSPLNFHFSPLRNKQIKLNCTKQEDKCFLINSSNGKTYFYSFFWCFFNFTARQDTIALWQKPTPASLLFSPLLHAIIYSWCQLYIRKEKRGGMKKRRTESILLKFSFPCCFMWTREFRKKKENKFLVLINFQLAKLNLEKEQKNHQIAEEIKKKVCLAVLGLGGKEQRGDEIKWIIKKTMKIMIM